MQTDDFEVFEQEIGEATDGCVGDVQVLQDGVGGVRPDEGNLLKGLTTNPLEDRVLESCSNSKNQLNFQVEIKKKLLQKLVVQGTLVSNSLYICLQELRIISFSTVNITQKL